MGVLFCFKGNRHVPLTLRHQWSSLLLCLHIYLNLLLILYQSNSQVDLAKGHRLAFRKLETMPTGCIPVNLGTGKGLSVMDIVKVCNAGGLFVFIFTVVIF